MILILMMTRKIACELFLLCENNNEGADFYYSAPEMSAIWTLELALALSSPAEMVGGFLLLTMPETVVERESRASMALLASGVSESSGSPVFRSMSH